MKNMRELTISLGGRWYGRYGIAPCPICQPERRRDQHALCISTGTNGRFLAYCHKSHCDFRAIVEAAGLGLQHCRSFAPNFAKPSRAGKRPIDQAKADIARRYWDEALPIWGTPPETYLKGRCITCDLPSTLRFSPSCWHGATGRAFPAMIARVDGADGFAVHRTYLRPGGSGKADIEPNKAMLGPCAGGAVRLADGPGPLVVAEGIETSLSLLCGLLDASGPVWAALSASGMMTLKLPPEPGRIIIAPDGDEAGRGAAMRLADRAYFAGWGVSIIPIADDFDWNDVLTGRAGI